MSDKKAAGKPSGKPKSGRNAQTKAGKQQGPQIPHCLKLSPQYLGWKSKAKRLAEVLKSFDMSISELGKAIADYSAKGCVFEIERKLVADYSDYEAARTAWETFRDSFRSSLDATSVPSGVAAQLLAAKPEPAATAP